MNSSLENPKDNETIVEGQFRAKPSQRNIPLIVIALILSGIFSVALSNWNSKRTKILLEWAADREGKANFSRIIHESGYSPGMIFRNPEILREQIGSDSVIVSAGVMRGENIIASFSKSSFEKKLLGFTSPVLGSTIIDSELTVFRKHTGPGSANGTRWHGAGQGPPWLRNDSNNEIDSLLDSRISFYVIFKGPDRDIIAPLVYQSYLWPVVWLIMTLMWGSILLAQSRMAKLQQLMQKDSHLASVGKMSARLAHEIKNPLGAVRGMAQLLSRKLKDQDDLRVMTNTIENETFRLEALTRSILDFSKPSECKLLKLDLVPVVSEALQFFKDQHKDIKITSSFPDSATYAVGDSNAIRQIIINLLKNAIESSEQGQEVNVILKASKGSVVLQFLNKGQLSEEVDKNKFEPFFSTKTSGYGLGLPICKKLAEQQNGKLKLVNFNKDFVLAELSLKEEF